jgi:hypothetical protein
MPTLETGESMPLSLDVDHNDDNWNSDHGSMPLPWPVDCWHRFFCFVTCTCGWYASFTGSQSQWWPRKQGHWNLKQRPWLLIVDIVASDRWHCDGVYLALFCKYWHGLTNKLLRWSTSTVIMYNCTAVELCSHVGRHVKTWPASCMSTNCTDLSLEQYIFGSWWVSWCSLWWERGSLWSKSIQCKEWMFSEST